MNLGRAVSAGGWGGGKRAGAHGKTGFSRRGRRGRTQQNVWPQLSSTGRESIPMQMAQRSSGRLAPPQPLSRRFQLCASGAVPGWHATMLTAAMVPFRGGCCSYCWRRVPVPGGAIYLASIFGCGAPNPTRVCEPTPACIPYGNSLAARFCIMISMQLM
eukprot:SAG22_NODE_9930_length_563_cov_0.670259_1_plen_158_part_10